MGCARTEIEKRLTLSGLRGYQLQDWRGELGIKELEVE
jgi:hypothetical protein